MPAPPTEIDIAVPVASRSRGIQRASKTITPMKTGAAPQPIRKSASASMGTLWEIEKMMAPSAARLNNPDMVRRGPNRSSRTPTGSCIRAAPRKIAAGRLESWPGVRPSSVRRLGAITAGAERRKCARMNVMASTGTMRRIAARRL